MDGWQQMVLDDLLFIEYVIIHGHWGFALAFGTIEHLSLHQKRSGLVAIMHLHFIYPFLHVWGGRNDLIMSPRAIAISQSYLISYLIYMQQGTADLFETNGIMTKKWLIQ